MTNLGNKKAMNYFSSNDHDLQFVLARAKKLSHIAAKVMAYLDPAIAAYCQIANLTGNKLIILTANGSIATQIRLQTADLLPRLQADDEPALKIIKSIHCKVQPDLIKPISNRNKSNKVEKLTSETANIIKAIADSLDDPKLKAIMQRIATRVK